MQASVPILFTNSLGRRLETFEPLDPSTVLMYTCGPTVYSYAHIGNFRSFIFADTVRRVLEYNGYRVKHVRNITDVGHLTDETLSTGLDRVEKAARERHQTPQDIVDYFTRVFLEDARRLNLLEPACNPRASDYVDGMISFTQELIEGEHAYRSRGNVYFDVSSFPGYGALSGNSVDELIAGARVEVGDGKRSPADFALWRHAGPEKLVRFSSPWGEGVPGWHIECSAMSRSLLADRIDIHTGGVDNLFPHHEDERAQSEAASGKSFVRYWLHSEWLQLPGDEKMSKSAGNISTVSDLVSRGVHPLTYRFFTFYANYRTPLNFAWEALEGAQTALFRIWVAIAELLQQADPGEIESEAESYRIAFHEAINRDLDFPVAVSMLHQVVGAKLAPSVKLALLHNFDTVLGLRLLETGAQLSELKHEHRALLKQRADARAAANWAQSDALRGQLADLGLNVRDTPNGQRWARTDLLP